MYTTLISRSSYVTLALSVDRSAVRPLCPLLCPFHTLQSDGTDCSETERKARRDQGDDNTTRFVSLLPDTDLQANNWGSFLSTDYVDGSDVHDYLC